MASDNWGNWSPEPRERGSRNKCWLSQRRGGTATPPPSRAFPSLSTLSEPYPCPTTVSNAPAPPFPDSPGPLYLGPIPHAHPGSLCSHAHLLQPLSSQEAAVTDAESPIERGFKDCGEGMRVRSEGGGTPPERGVRRLALSHLLPSSSLGLFPPCSDVCV